MQEQTRRRVGLMGGTFDPIHIGHLMLAECAYEQFQLEQVLFLPAGNPPHKDKRKVGATDAQRIDMVRLAIEGNPHFKLDPEEMLRKGYTYTKDTLNLLTQQHPDIDYYFIIGADSLMAFDTWYHPEEICRDSWKRFRRKCTNWKNGFGPEFTFCRHRMSTSHPVIFGRCAVRNVPSGIM